MTPLPMRRIRGGRSTARLVCARLALLACCALAFVARPRVGIAWGADAANSDSPLSVDTEVIVLYASSDGDGGRSVDPRIDSKLPLDRPPFSLYGTYKLVLRSPAPAKKGVARLTSLPNGRTLELTLRDALPGKRYRLAARILEANGSVFLPMFELTTGIGEPFFVAGQAYQGGVLFVGTVLR